MRFVVTACKPAQRQQCGLDHINPRLPPNMTSLVFSSFFWQPSSRYTVSCAFFRPHCRLPKFFRSCQLFAILKCKTSSHYSLLTFCQELSPIEARKCPLETQSFAPEIFFTRGLVHFPTTTCWGWHDDVVDMMLWMPAMTIVRNSEVCWLNFLW